MFYKYTLKFKFNCYFHAATGFSKFHIHILLDLKLP